MKRIHFSFVCRFRNAKAKKIVVLTVTCQENGLVCRDVFPTQMLKLTFLILRYRFCIHNGNRKLNLAIVSAANIVLFFFFISDLQFLFCNMKIFWKM